MDRTTAHHDWEPRSEADRAHAQLRASLLSGVFLPGERLRPAELQQRFGIGLTPIREALTRLGVEGLVLGAAQRGFRVREASVQEFSDLMETRRELERACLVRSIERGNETWEAEIVAAMHALSRADLPKTPRDAQSAATWEQRHRRFHLALIAACASKWRLQFWHTLADHSQRYRKLRILRRRDPVAQVRNLNDEHERIMRAVLARDTDKACRLMDEHLRATERSVKRMLTASD